MQTTAATVDNVEENSMVTKDAALTAEQRLAIAAEALAAIVAENDLTCMRALFRMRRRAEVALARITAADHPRH